MSISNSDKREIIRLLLVMKQRAHDLEISLRFKGQNGEADQIAQNTKKLSDKIDILLGQVMVDWLSEAATILQEINQANNSLQSSIQEIQDGVRTAQNVVKAIGYIDDAVAIAAKVAATL